MPKLPLMSAREVSQALKKRGFILKRQEGSHMFFEHPDGRTTVIPNTIPVKILIVDSSTK